MTGQGNQGGDEETIRVSEIVLTVSPDGQTSGWPTVLVRTGKAVWAAGFGSVGGHATVTHIPQGWKSMAASQVLERIRELSGPCLVTLAGADPASEPMDGLIHRVQGLGYRVLCEVDGTVPADWFANLDHLSINPHTPSRGGTSADLSRLGECLSVAYTGHTYTDVAFTVSVADESDYVFARGLYELHPSVPIFLTASTLAWKNLGPERLPKSRGGNPAQEKNLGPEGFSEFGHEHAGVENLSDAGRSGEIQIPTFGEARAIVGFCENPESISHQRSSNLAFCHAASTAPIGDALRWLCTRAASDRWTDVRIGVSLDDLSPPVAS